MNSKTIIDVICQTTIMILCTLLSVSMIYGFALVIWLLFAV